MTAAARRRGSILMLSLHGYVAARPELGRPDTGGQVTFVLELARELGRLGFRVDVVTRRFEDQPAVDRLEPGISVWRVPFGGRAFIRKEDMHDHLDGFVVRFLEEVQARRVHYDVVDSHYWDAGWAGQQIAEELRIPHVFTPHSLGTWKRAQMEGTVADPEKTYRFTERIEKEFMVARSADHVIATTYEQEQVLREDYGLPGDHVSVIPPGFAEQRFTPVPADEVAAARRRLGFGDRDVYAVGRAARNKGYDLLVRAMPFLRASVPDARLVLAVGAGSEVDQSQVATLRELAAEEGVADAIVWRDYVPDEDMADCYRAAAVFALSSRYEPFGMTAIEAMACGTPTVITVHGGLHRIVDFGTHALYADPLDPRELAAMLGLPLRYPDLARRLSVEGSRVARRRFGWRGIARQTVPIFDRLRGRYAPEGDGDEAPRARTEGRVRTAPGTTEAAS